jgi:predicted phage tail protein
MVLGNTRMTGAHQVRLTIVRGGGGGGGGCGVLVVGAAPVVIGGVRQSLRCRSKERGVRDSPNKEENNGGGSVGFETWRGGLLRWSALNEMHGEGVQWMCHTG